MEYFIRNPMRISGHGYTEEIDESAFVRRKANVGRVVNTNSDQVGDWRD